MHRSSAPRHSRLRAVQMSYTVAAIGQFRTEQSICCHPSGRPGKVITRTPGVSDLAHLYRTFRPTTDNSQSPQVAPIGVNQSADVARAVLGAQHHVPKVLQFRVLRWLSSPPARRQSVPASPRSRRTGRVMRGDVGMTPRIGSSKTTAARLSRARAGRADGVDTCPIAPRTSSAAASSPDSRRSLKSINRCAPSRPARRLLSCARLVKRLVTHKSLPWRMAAMPSSARSQGIPAVMIRSMDSSSRIACTLVPSLACG